MENVSIVLCLIMEPLTKILSASVELFKQYGFKTITMDDIARRAGISKKTLYQHFANKSEVVNESVNFYKCKMTEQCDGLIKGAENAVEALVCTSKMIEMTYKNINPQSMLEMQRFFPQAFDMFRNGLLQRDFEMLRDNLEQGVREGYYREGLNTDLMARYRLEIALLMFQSNLLINDRSDLMMVSKELFEHFLYGIFSPKGLKLYEKYKDKYLKLDLK
jgi:AcrR family transcriptional regulator